MKKLIILLGLSLFLTSCGGKKDSYEKIEDRAVSFPGEKVSKEEMDDRKFIRMTDICQSYKKMMLRDSRVAEKVECVEFEKVYKKQKGEDLYAGME